MSFGVSVGDYLQSLSLVQNTLGDFSFFIYLFPFVSKPYRIKALARYYGISTSIVLNLLVRDLWCIEASLLNSRNDEEAKAFRQTHQNECNMTAVTGAIVASIAITALNLADVQRTHWSARALFVSSLILSLFSVYCASKQQKTIGRLLHASQLRRFIRVKKDIVTGTTLDLYRFHRAVKLLKKEAGFGKSNADSSEALLKEMSTDKVHPREIDLPSPVSCILLSVPRFLLASSVVTFLVALGVYLGYLMDKHLEDGYSPFDNRNIFIVYCAVFALSIALYVQSTLVQMSQADIDEGDRIMIEVAMKRKEYLERLRPESALNGSSKAEPKTSTTAAE